MRNVRVLLVATLALLIVGSQATVTVAQVDVGTVFEIDGNIADDPGNAENDWVNNNCPAIDASTASVNTGIVSDPPGATIFTQGGSKDKLDVSNWMYTNGSVPDKDDIDHAYAAEYAATGASGPTTVLVVGGDRFSNDGSAFIGAWFFQNAVGLAPITKAATGSFSGVHANGDMLILAEFSQGGVVATPKVFEWVGSPGPCPSGPCPAATEKGGTLADVTPAPGNVLVAAGLSNSSPQTIPSSCSTDWAYTPKSGTPGTIPANSFFEVGIDLGVVGLGNECFASFLLETRSSADVDAQLKDFVLHAFAPCAISCSKSVAPTAVCLGNSATYTYSVTNSGGVNLNVKASDAGSPSSPSSFNVCMPGVSGDPCTTSAVACSFSLPAGQTKSCTLGVTPNTSGSFTDTLSVDATPSSGTTHLNCTSSATLMVNPNPTASINSLPCPFAAQSQFTLTATPSGGTPGYSFSWTPGGETTSSINRSQGGSFGVTVTDSKGCKGSATRGVGYCSD